jgi:hypothetical protein
MNPLKGTLAKRRTLFIGSILLVGLMAMISMPQMIGSANAQSEEASERACPVPGYTLSKGECTAEPTTTELTCDPSSVAGIPVEQSGSRCGVFGSPSVITQGVCNEIEGGMFSIISQPGAPLRALCEFPATETPICPGDVVPTEEGECITKPGRGNDPRT